MPCLYIGYFSVQFLFLLQLKSVNFCLVEHPFKLVSIFIFPARRILLEHTLSDRRSLKILCLVVYLPVGDEYVVEKIPCPPSVCWFSKLRQNVVVCRNDCGLGTDRRINISLQKYNSNKYVELKMSLIIKLKNLTQLLVIAYNGSVISSPISYMSLLPTAESV